MNRTEVLALLEAASRLMEPYNSNRSYTQKELYDYFDSHFTKNYVDHIILSNLKQENGRWQVAFPESELGYGTYYDTSFDDRTRVEQTREGVTVIHRVENGLYPAHEEQIQIIFTSSGWKINGLWWYSDCG
ncbi:hypothetical protein WMW72_01830 [Paenibacillus filicis]|uniref:Uncharacterized protein n=1 Tax=Paenibacillus filicis TaxID=669464 RepID=A0ABU9DCS0_9BACL